MWFKRNFFKIKSQLNRKLKCRQISFNNKFTKLLVIASSPIPIYLACQKRKSNHTPSCFVNESLAHSNDDHHILRFFIMVINNNLQDVQRYINGNYNINQKNKVGLHPLHIACANGNKAMVELLTENGADVNATDDFVRNYNPTETIRTVCLKNVNPGANTEGFTPLHYAVLSGSADIISYLVRNGADPKRRCGSGSDLSEKPEDLIDEKFHGKSQARRILSALNENVDKYVHERLEKLREYRRNNPLENTVKARIVGQLTPIQTVAAALRRKQNGWAKEDQPLVFLFLGSSGVGKTELAKQLAAYIHPKKKDAFVRLDLSEFQGRHEVSKFIGSPPGYVGFEQGGQLTSKLKEHPDAVVLLDEVDKAHPDVLTVMLQLFDEGRITDGKGTTVHCPNAIFVMTSNLAQREIADNSEKLRTFVKNEGDLPIDGEKPQNGSFPPKKRSADKKFVEETIYPILRRQFRRDEFIGRINEILFFLPFDADELRTLTNIELEKWAEKAKDRHNIELSWSKDVVDVIKDGYNKYYGARSIQNEVDRKVINKIAKAHENNLIKRGSSVNIYEKNGEIELKIE